MAEIDEQGPSGKRNWRRIGLIAGGVFIVLMVIGALAGGPEEDKVATDALNAAAQVTTTQAPTTTAQVTTTDAPTTTHAPTTTEPVTTTTAAPPPPTTAPPATAPPTTADPFANESVSQRNARRTAADYLDYESFSRSGLIDQLKFEGFGEGDATYGVDALYVDWNEQAAKSAADYLDYESFSHSGLVDQLVFEGFTPAQAEYGVSTTGL